MTLTEMLLPEFDHETRKFTLLRELAVYLRLQDGSLPSVYGLTADV